MSEPETSEVVASFVTAHLRTVDDLHLLVAMAAARDRWFDAESVARELGISRKKAQTVLEHLASRNLLEIRLSADIRYQFHPGTPELLAGTNACVDAYMRNPVAMWRLVSRRVDHDGIRDFADAFRIKRHDDR